MSGLGHPESANLTGLSDAYIEQQMEDFRSGARKDAARMNAIAAAISDSDCTQASAWFASLMPAPWFKVTEADTVPKTYVNRGRMRLPSPDGGTEALGDRIVELPQDAARTESRDPHSGFIAYVPVGSLAKGEKLVMAGGAGKTIGCDNCHGADLRGDKYIPPIAGRSPGYTARQLYGFQHFTRNGPGAGLMQPVVKNLTPEDILDIAAYLASVSPERAKAAK
jgi:cytochrome c553